MLQQQMQQPSKSTRKSIQGNNEQARSSLPRNSGAAGHQANKATVYMTTNLLEQLNAGAHNQNQPSGQMYHSAGSQKNQAVVVASMGGAGG